MRGSADRQCVRKAVDAHRFAFGEELLQRDEEVEQPGRDIVMMSITKKRSAHDRPDLSSRVVVSTVTVSGMISFSSVV